MFKRIDEIDAMKIEGFSYYNRRNCPESVRIRMGSVDICTDNNDSVPIYHEDIPKLIKALQETCKHLGIDWEYKI